jgi:pilus assembly protein FimV
MEVATPTSADETQQFGSLEDTFSSDTAINLDQSDPIAEADFHMAYGLYDQAADLINGALAVEPQRQDLLTKLCEIYFVWGNRDSFVDAAERLHTAAGGGTGSDWDKIVIMGQQIAGDHAMFAGAGVAAATKEVDLSFEADSDASGALDMDFGSQTGEDEIIDLGGDDDGDGVDFMFDADDGANDVSPTSEEIVDLSSTSEMSTIETAEAEPTVEMPPAETTVETPTIEEQFAGFDGATDATSELPSISPEALAGTIAGDETAEINLDDLGLDLDGLAETEIASLDDLETTGANEALSETGMQEALDEITGKNLKMDEFDLDIGDDLADSGNMRLAADETGKNPMLDPAEEDLLAATGRTQVLSEDHAVSTITDPDELVLDGNYGDDDATLADSDATMLAPGVDDEEDFDFAKTEALPPGTYEGNLEGEETGELPAVASTDVDLDLDDLTAALQVSEMGDTVDMPRDDATVEQPRPGITPQQAAETVELAPDDISDDLHEARTMTEVGTKLDLARAYVDMGDPAGARSILEEVLDEGDDGQRQQAQQLLDSLPS